MAEPEPPTSSGTVDAQEHARVLKNFVDLSDQFAAANEVLSALGRSAGDPDAVLTTVVESARRLCRSQAAHLYVLEDGVLPADQGGRAVRGVDSSTIADHPIPLDRETLLGRVALDRRAQQIADVLADAGLRPARPAARGRVPHDHGRADAPRRRGRRRARTSGAPT